MAFLYLCFVALNIGHGEHNNFTEYTGMQYGIKCNLLSFGASEAQLSRFTSLEKVLCCIGVALAFD